MARLLPFLPSFFLLLAAMCAVLAVLVDNQWKLWFWLAGFLMALLAVFAAFHRT